MARLISAMIEEAFDINSSTFKNIVVFDLETTGFNPKKDEIIQIAAMKIKNGTKILKTPFHSFVKPKAEVPIFITSLTGISQNDLKRAPTVTKALSRFSDYCGDSLLVAHNGRRFDMKFIEHACRGCKKNARAVSYIDSMQLSWILWGWRNGKSHCLDDVRRRLKVNIGDNRRHNALGDVSVTSECLLKMFSRLDKSYKGHPIKIYTSYIPL
jgi:DNA polymerase III epsilon subunit family exonuclease